MLDELNRYAHGYIAVPVILACRRGGLFTLLEDQGPLSVEAAAEALGANRGYLRIAWRMLRSLGWLKGAGDDRFALSDAASTAGAVPDELADLLDFDFDRYLDGRGSLDSYIARSERRWGIDDPVAADLLDGAFVVPLLVMLARRRSVDMDGSAPFAGLPSPAREELERLFANKDWLPHGAAGPLTSEGRFMLERAMNTATVLSYRPMMQRVGELLFGDSQAVFERLEDGHEGHVDRTLNVIGSGFQHEKYFRDLDEVILSIFDREPFAEQPRYVADMGSGDGTLLKRVFDVVRDRSARGKVLDRYPLTMIGLDYNDASLTETARTLADIPHMTLHADIGDPAAMLTDLKAAGVDEPERILHIRSFLDHDRPYKAPLEPVVREHLDYQGVYVDKSGRDIPPAEAIQSLAEHLGRWAALGSRHGLIIIEVHSLGPDTVRAHLSESENLHFDTMQAFSGQFLVEADVFVLAAAEAGLFPTPRFALRYPKVLPFCRITQNRFENRPYRARNARADDVAALARLEELCWEESIRTPTPVIAERIRQHPDDVCVFEQDGAVIGVIYAQRIEDADALKTSRYADVPALHVEGGQVMQLLGFNVDPQAQGRGYGDEFIEFGLHWLSLKPRVRSIVGVSRCKGFDSSRMALDEYVRARDGTGALLDPILRFHQQHGAEVRGLVPGYRPEDTANLGTGVLIEYAPDRRLRKAEAVANAGGTDGRAASPGLSLVRLEDMLTTLLGPARKDAFAPDRPLRQIGLDSLDLLEFRTLLSRETGQKVEPTFFFQYSTPRAISEFFSGGAAKPAGKSKARTPRPAASSPIAIIGASCRFPGGSSSPDALWDLLANGRDAVSEVPADRWDLGPALGDDADCAWRRAMRYGGFLDGVDLFDAGFFDVAPREARLLDPQQRLMLELCWEALEDAAVDPTSLAGSDAGVFAGVFSHDYECLQLLARPDSIADIYFATGTNSSVAAGRVAYVLGLQGPALAVNTACSSSLVAVHLAAQAIRNGECGVALAGGVNVMLAPQLSETFARANMLAPDGRCKTFDAAANGYVRSEGAGIVFLKSLDRAQRDGDRILGVIRGTAINQDGASNGLTAPSAFAQQDVIERALRDAEVEPADVSYLEAHGTGTALGDPVEVAAIAAAYGRGRGADRPLVLGSLKTNIGHAESAAGIGGLLKVILSLQHGYIPPHLHFESPNPHLELDAVPAVIPARGLDWPPDGERRRIGAISSFGFSGTNAHVIVEEAPPAAPRPRAGERPAHVLALSARSAPALAAQARRFADYFESREELLDIADVCHTANCGRAHLEHRLAVVGGTLPVMAAALRDFAEDGRSEAAWMTSAVSGARGARERRRVAFLFGGRGDDWRAMARSLLASEPAFRGALERCDAVLARELGQHLVAHIAGQADGAEIEEAAALLAVQYAYCELMRSWGVEPDLVVGHGAGECMAAVAAGVLGIDDGLKLAAARARFLRRAANGARLAAVHADAGTVEQLLQPLAGKAAIAAINGVTEFVVSTTPRGATALASRCKEQGIGYVPLDAVSPIPVAEAPPAGDELERTAAGLAYGTAGIPFISCTAGGLAGPETASADFWRGQAAQPADIAGAAAALARSGVDAVLEIGPATSLPGLLRKAAGHPVRKTEWLTRAESEVPAPESALRSLARLHAIGGLVDWRAFDRDRGARKIALPGYAFQRERYWFDDAGEGAAPLTRERLLRAARASRVTDGVTLRRFAERVNPALDRICAGYVLAALQTLGWRPRAGDELEPAALARELGILPRHQRLVGRMFEMLAEDGVLARNGAVFVVEKVPRSADPAGELRELHGEHPDLSVEFALLGRCGPELAQVLRGECDPLQLIFPDGDLDGATRFYEDTPFSRDCNAMMAAAVDAVVRHAPDDRPLRILELGAGTGGTTAHLLPRLDAKRTEYAFTDVSPLFTARAAERFADYPFVAYRLLDIARDPASQDFVPGSFDLVIASNVLHATPNLRATLDNARQLLAPGGRLLLVEGTERARWIDLIFGLTEGWWLFKDVDLRPSHPLLTDASWLATLEQCGYSDAAVVPNADLSGGALFAQALVIGTQPTSVATERGPVRLLGERISPAGEQDVYLFDAPLDLRRHAWLGDHKVDGNVVFPAAAYIEMALAAARELPNAAAFSLHDLELTEAMFLDADRPRRVQLKAVRRGGSYELEIFSARAAGRDDGMAWQRHARGRLAAPAGAGAGAVTRDLSADTGDAVTHEDHYAAMRALGLDYGPRFRGVESVTCADERVTARLRAGAPAAGYVFDPAIADAALQTAVALAAEAMQPSGAQCLWLPVRCAEIVLQGSGAPVRAIAIPGRGAHDGDRYVADVTAFDANGRTALSVRALELQRVERATLSRGSSMLHRLAWIPAPLPDAVGEAAGPWLVATSGDPGGEGEQLAAALMERGVDCDVLDLSPAGDRKRALRSQLEALRSARGTPWRQVVYCATTASGSNAEGMSPDPMADQQRLCEGLLLLVQELAAENRNVPALLLVTRNAVAAGDEPDGLTLAQTALAGLRRVVALECPELRCRHVDLDNSTDARLIAEWLVAESAGGGEEDEVAWRGGVRRVSRLVRHAQAESSGEWQVLAGGRPVELTPAAGGTLEGLRFAPAEAPRPAAGEVSIRVLATGLNFKDVLNVIGFRDGQARPGLEAAGVVAAVGPGVDRFRVGDRVAAIGTGAFATCMTTAAELVVPAPAGFDMARLATIPIAFLTAHWALRHLTRLEPGERVLVHAASGGVGLAAVQLARAAGATVFGTAGSERKRAWLREIGVEHVLDSRSLSFADEVRARTAGEGVDVVLNCLAGEFIDASLDVLAKNGRFIELGIRDILDEREVAARRPDVAYYTVDLADTMNKEPRVLEPMLAAIFREIGEHQLEPLPYTCFPLERTVQAFGYMQRALHIGKVVVTQSACGVNGRLAASAFGRGTCLLTGGLGPLGLATARWLAEHGATHLVLLGRRAPQGEAAAVVEELQKAGVEVAVHRCDITQRAELAAVLRSIADDMPPLAGVFHLAGTLADGVLRDQDWERFDTVLAPKVLGAWHLHELTRDIPLDCFVLYSSWASLLGSPGQANHSTANAFMDALAHHRQALGLPALSVNWAAWKGAGSAMHGDRLEQLGGRGIGDFSFEEALKLLGQLLSQGAPQVAVMPFDVGKWRSRSAAAARSHRFDELEDTAAAEPPRDEPQLAELLAGVPPGAPRVARLQQFVLDQLAVTLNTSGSRIETDASFRSLGLDSLTGLELRNRLETCSGLGLPATIVWNYPSVERLAQYLAERLADDEAGAEDDAAGDEEVASLLEELESLSDEEARHLLAARGDGTGE